jgi:tetratricopeptide (TPR) repeat protein
VKPAPRHHPDALLTEAISLHRAGHLDPAEKIYRTILASDRKYFSALTLLGMLCLQRGDRQEGIKLTGRSLAINPSQPDAYYNRGNALNDLKRYAEAVADYDRALALHRAFPEAWNNRGSALKELNRYDDALASYGEAIAHEPAFVGAYNNRATVLTELGRGAEALRDYDKALALQPNVAFLHYNRGHVLGELKRYDDALASFQQAIALKPDYAEAHVSRGGVLHAMTRYDEALASCDQAIVLKPDYAEAHEGRGGVLHAMKLYDEALASCDQAIVLKPDYAEAHHHKACLQILLGQWDGAWESYEWRWKKKGQTNGVRQFRFDGRPVRHFQQPLWLGEENPTERTILLHAEQGLGDTILFCRYVPMVEALGAKVVVEVPAVLFGLISTVSRSAHVVLEGSSLPSFDFHCPLMSLPFAFKTTLNTVPANVPYLAVEPHKQKEWRERLGPKTRPRVGLVWSGSGQSLNVKRDVPFAEFQRIIRPGLDYSVLQKGIRPEDKELLARRREITIYENALDNFADTAALAAEMDLIISIDTSVAHLAGALGKPIWLLLPEPPAWF